ncbi:MAG: hypothetical protein AB1610_05715 [Nitrospirota bacterium]
MNLLKKHLIAYICLTLIIISGCAGKKAPSFYIATDVDFSFIKRVAVLPLNNLTNDKFAGEIIRHVVVSELLASGLVDCVSPGDAVAAIEKLKLKNEQSLGAEQIKALGKVLNVQAVIMGAVEKFGEVREGNISTYEVTITLMMADANSGNIIWSVTKTSAGASFWEKHFGARAETLSETVLKVVRDAIHTLYDY